MDSTSNKEILKSSPPVDVAPFDHLLGNNAPSKSDPTHEGHPEVWQLRTDQKLVLSAILMAGYGVSSYLFGAENPAFTHTCSDQNTNNPDQCFPDCDWNEYLRKISTKSFWPNVICQNRHVSTLSGYLRKSPDVKTRREIIQTGDGGIVALDWAEYDPYISPEAWTATSPTLLLIHGLNGHSEEAYIKYMMLLAHRKGWRSVGFNHRGCGNTKLLTPRPYNGANTADICAAINHIHRRWPLSTLYAAGFSLGANLLVKYLGQEKENTPVLGAVSVSNPWDLAKNTEVCMGTTLEGKIYSLALTHELKNYVKEHRSVFDKVKGLDVDEVLRSTTIKEFDERATVPLWGYSSLQEYYQDASSARYLSDVQVPLMAINALDDPVVSKDCIPVQEFKQKQNLILVTTRQGGHIGWSEGFNPTSGASWAEKLAIVFLDSVQSKAASTTNLVQGNDFLKNVTMSSRL